MPDKQKVEIRAATKLDLPEIQNIFNHYVTTSVVTFQIEPLTPDSIIQKFEDAQRLDLPYLVATVHQHDFNNRNAERTAADKPEKIVGYASASGFRNFLEGYKHSVEVALFLHLDFHSQGIGTQLLSSLLDALRLVGANSVRPKVKEVIACMAIDAESSDGTHGEGLRHWYENRGFREVGRMRDVGRKFERWLSVVFLQCSLRSEEDMQSLV